MKSFMHLLSLGLLGMALVACSQGASPQLQGGTEDGNPYQYREVIGKVPPYGDFCKVDEVVATTEGEVLEINIKQDCSFTGKLKIGSVYGVNLIDDDELLAPVLFGSDQNNASPYFRVYAGPGPIDLGMIGLEDSEGDVFGWPENIGEIWEESQEEETTTQSQTGGSRYEIGRDDVSHVVESMTQEEDDKEYKLTEEGVYKAMVQYGGLLEVLKEDEPEREENEQRLEAVENDQFRVIGPVGDGSDDDD